jgi:hypothetical protein
MDEIIRKNAVSGCLMSPEKFKKLSRANVSWHYFDRPYFFFTRELEHESLVDDVEYARLKKESIRHLVPYNDGYYDYIVHSEYTSLNEWAIANGETLDNIRYGVVKKHRKNAANPIVAWVELKQLLRYLDPDYTETSTAEVIAMIDDIVERIISIRSLIERIV